MTATRNAKEIFNLDFKFTFAVCPRLPWLRFSGVVEAFFLLRLYFFYRLYLAKGESAWSKNKNKVRRAYKQG